MHDFLLTELKENMPITLSHDVPSFGAHAIRLLRALAKQSERWKKSAVENVLPVNPQVNGFRLLATGNLP
jgi:hypothetical protein